MTLANLRSHVHTALQYLDRNVAFRNSTVKAWAQSLPSATRILDVGAGLSKYKDFFGHCEYRTHDHPGADFGVVDVRSDITHIPLPDASLDAILCTEVLEHVPDPTGAVREMARLLRPGGQLLLTVPAACRVHLVPTHFWGGFAPDFFHKLLPENGLTVKELRPIGNWSSFMAQELGRMPEVVRHNTSLPMRNIISAAIWPLFRITVPVALLGLSKLDHTKDLPLGWACFAQK